MSLFVIFMSPHVHGDNLQENFLCIGVEYLEVVPEMIVLSYVDFVHGPVYELVSVVETGNIHHPSIYDLIQTKMRFLGGISPYLIIVVPVPGARAISGGDRHPPFVLQSSAARSVEDSVLAFEVA